MTVGLLYVVLLAIGVTYALIAGTLGWLFDSGHADTQVDASGHLEAGHPHWLSSTIVATFITGFGGGGVLVHYLLAWPRLAGLAVATASGMALAAAAFGVLELIFKQTQAGSEFGSEEAVGREAEVITAIPAGGTGEVAYVVRGQREQAAARSTSGEGIPRGCPVVIERVTGSTVHVRPKA